MEKFAIRVENVSKTFKQGIFRPKYTEALTNVSLSVKYGEIFGLLGPNGAGKTTLLNILSSQLLPNSGKVSILGLDTNSMHMPDLKKLKMRINMCSGNPNFPWSLTVFEILKFYSMLYGCGPKECSNIIEENINLFELEKYRNIRYDRLSMGTKQRLALAKSLLNEPEILFLDEPTIGLDPDIARKIRLRIAEINKKKKITIVLTTHYMKEAEQLCGRIAFIKDGRIKAIGTKRQLEKLTKKKNLEEVFLNLVS